MDIRAILTQRGLTAEKIDQLINDPAYASILEGFINDAEQGKTALQKAQEVEQNLKKWNDTEVVPYVRAADEKVAKREAELAAMKAHMKSLKDAGYDIPDAYLEAPSTPVTPKQDATPAGFSKTDFDKGAMEIAETNMALVSLSNKHRKLTGDELDLESEYTDFKANRRPDENLRSYVARKYDHAGKEKAAAEAKRQKELDDYAAEKIKAEKAQWAQNNGSNPETRNPKSSRFDTIKQDEGRRQLWQTAQGRDEATKRRLEKYTNLVTQ